MSRSARCGAELHNKEMTDRGGSPLFLVTCNWFVSFFSGCKLEKSRDLGLSFGLMGKVPVITFGSHLEQICRRTQGSGDHIWFRFGGDLQKNLHGVCAGLSAVTEIAFFG